MRLAITGHRPKRLQGKEKEVQSWILNKIDELNPDICISGMAEGVDQIFAYSTLQKNKQLWCVYPYLKKKNFYTIYLEEKADRILYTQKEYSKDCYFIRDKYIVDNCDILLAVWDGKPNGGTYWTIKYANSINKPIKILRI